METGSECSRNEYRSLADLCTNASRLQLGKSDIHILWFYDCLRLPGKEPALALRCFLGCDVCTVRQRHSVHRRSHSGRMCFNSFDMLNIVLSKILLGFLVTKYTITHVPYATVRAATISFA